jgi:cytoskeletal protein CcmA (bactofilin family)
MMLNANNGENGDVAAQAGSQVVETRSTGTYGGGSPAATVTSLRTPGSGFAGNSQSPAFSAAAGALRQDKPQDHDRLESLLGDDLKGFEKIIAIDEGRDRIRSVVASGDEFKGDLVLSEGGRISGIVRGDVTATNGALVIDAGAFVYGNVYASKRLVVLGTIGSAGEKEPVEVNCPGLIIAAGNSVINGSVVYGQLAVYDAAATNGSIRRHTAESLARIPVSTKA